MTFDQLAYGNVFRIDGQYFQLWLKGQRVALCLHLDPNMSHVPEPGDGSGTGLKTSAFSDLRINRNNASAAECETYFKSITNGPHTT